MRLALEILRVPRAFNTRPDGLLFSASRTEKGGAERREIGRPQMVLASGERADRCPVGRGRPAWLRVPAWQRVPARERVPTRERAPARERGVAGRGCGGASGGPGTCAPGQKGAPELVCAPRADGHRQTRRPRRRAGTRFRILRRAQRTNPRTGARIATRGEQRRGSGVSYLLRPPPRGEAASPRAHATDLRNPRMDHTGPFGDRTTVGSASLLRMLHME